MHTHQRSSDPVAKIGLEVGVPCRHFVQMLRSRIGTKDEFAATQENGPVLRVLLTWRRS
jgi:hypothetical protein